MADCGLTACVFVALLVCKIESAFIPQLCSSRSTVIRNSKEKTATRVTLLGIPHGEVPWLASSGSGQVAPRAKSSFWNLESGVGYKSPPHLSVPPSCSSRPESSRNLALPRVKLERVLLTALAQASPCHIHSRGLFRPLGLTIQQQRGENRRV